MADEKEIDELVALLDQFMEQGGGHMNVSVNNPQELNQLNVETYNSTCCSDGNSACAVPTLHKGIDE